MEGMIVRKKRKHNGTWSRILMTHNPTGWSTETDTNDPVESVRDWAKFLSFAADKRITSRGISWKEIPRKENGPDSDTV